MLLKEQWKKYIHLLVEKQFWLINLKTILETYRFIIKKMWFLASLLLIVSGIAIKFYNILWLPYLVKIIEFVFLFSMYVFARPSLSIKNLKYFKQFKLQYSIYIIISYLNYKFLGLLSENRGDTTEYKIITFLLIVVFIMYQAGLKYSFYFFLMDNNITLKNILKAIANGIKFLFYILSFWFIIELIRHVIGFMLKLTGFDFFNMYIKQLVLINLEIITIIIISSLYIKQIHENSESYKI